jgi:hypothetical protein
MVRRGTVVNGVIVPDGPSLPEGTKVYFDPCEDSPFTDETYEEFIESLRESIAAAKAGDVGEPAEVVFAQIREELRQHASKARK